MWYNFVFVNIKEWNDPVATIPGGLSAENILSIRVFGQSQRTNTGNYIANCDVKRAGLGHTGEWCGCVWFDCNLSVCVSIADSVHRTEFAQRAWHARLLRCRHHKGRLALPRKGMLQCVNGYFFLLVFLSTQLSLPMKGRYQHTDTLCGEATPKPIMSNGNRMLLEFKGYQSNKRMRGFRADFSFLESKSCW
jgi:hypothetical protein